MKKWSLLLRTPEVPKANLRLRPDKVGASTRGGPPDPAGDLKFFLKKLNHGGRRTVKRSSQSLQLEWWVAFISIPSLLNQITQTQAASVLPNTLAAGYSK